MSLAGGDGGLGMMQISWQTARVCVPPAAHFPLVHEYFVRGGGGGRGVMGAGVIGAWHKCWHTFRSTPDADVMHCTPEHMYLSTAGPGAGVCGA